MLLAQGLNPNAALFMQGLAASGGGVNPASSNNPSLSALPNLKAPLPEVLEKSPRDDRSIERQDTREFPPDLPLRARIELLNLCPGTSRYYYHEDDWHRSMNHRGMMLAR